MPAQAKIVGPMPPFFLFRDFLAEDDHAELLAWTLEHQSSFGPSVVGKQSRIRRTGLLGKVRNQRDTTLRSSLTLAKSIEAPWQSKIRERVESMKSAMFEKAGVEQFDISRIELELAAYGNGAQFKVHRDTAFGAGRGTDDRLLSGVYYFHAEPKGFSGGELRLHRFGTIAAKEGDFVDIAPVQNSFVVFPSWAYHEVRRVSVSFDRFADYRFAINCWLRRARM